MGGEKLHVAFFSFGAELGYIVFIHTMHGFVCMYQTGLWLWVEHMECFWSVIVLCFLFTILPEETGLCMSIKRKKNNLAEFIGSPHSGSFLPDPLHSLLLPHQITRQM
ncbi:hypothetical protein FKM82_005940 [Ascaphus truei]